MQNDRLVDIWSKMDFSQRVEWLTRLKVKDVALRAESLGIEAPELDEAADLAGLVPVYVTVVDVAGMRDIEPAVAGPAFAGAYRKRKSRAPAKQAA